MGQRGTIYDTETNVMLIVTVKFTAEAVRIEIPVSLVARARSPGDGHNF